MTEHFIAELEAMADGVLRVRHFPTFLEAQEWLNPPEPEPEPEPVNWADLPADTDVEAWLGRPLDTLAKAPSTIVTVDDQVVRNIRDTYISIQGDRTHLDGFYRRATLEPQTGDGLRVDGYRAPVQDVLIENVWVGSAPNAAHKNDDPTLQKHHVDGLQITGPHLVTNVTVRRAFFGRRYNAAIMMHDFTGTLTLDQVRAVNGPIHCVRLNTETGKRATLVLRNCDIDEISLKGDWAVDDNGTSRVGTWHFTT